MFIIRDNCSSSRRSIFASLALCYIIAITPSVASGQVRGPEDLRTRLARLETRLDAERQQLHIPGLAIAVVRGDKVVLARGFGYRDLQAKKPVTAETLFAIGSTTKAFTATLIGMLADEAKMDWDDPVSKYIPDFRLKIDTRGNEVTVRDLLCHRTGFTRMGVLWASGRLTRSEVLEHVALAEPFGKFRKQFLYNNVMYMAAGHAAGKAAGSDWAALVAAKILKPLHMSDSSTSITVAQKNPHLAKGYLWNERLQRFKRLPMRNVDLVGPAGSINSNANDMAQWLRFQLGKGVYGGKRLLSVKAHGETWKQQIRMAPGVGYGLGWMLREWNGKKVIEHGGSIDGFAAQVSLLPEHDLGYVLLANVTATPLQQKSINIVFDALLGAGTEDAATIQAKNVGGLLGKYVANFGSWRDARFTVLRKDGKLALDVPKQRVYELKAPDADGKWYFAMTDQIAVSFKRNDEGKSISLTMYQSGMEFECVREGVVYAPEVPLKMLQSLVGSYRDEKSGRKVKVIILNNRLALDELRGALFELAPPDDEGKWSLRANKKRLQVRFNRAEDGSIRSMTRIQRGREVEMPRVATGAEESMPTVDALIKMIRRGYGAEKLAALGHVRLTGTVTFVHQGARGEATQLTSGVQRMASEIDLGKIGIIRTAHDGHRAWIRSTFSPFEELFGPRLKQLECKHPLWILKNWRGIYDNAVVVGSDQVAGERVHLLRFSGEGIPKRTVAVSAKSGLVLMEKTVEILSGITGFPVTLTYSDYRRVRGVMLPFKVVAKTTQMGEIVTQFDKATILDVVNDEAFRLSPTSGRRDK